MPHSVEGGLGVILKIGFQVLGMAAQNGLGVALSALPARERTLNDRGRGIEGRPWNCI